LASSSAAALRLSWDGSPDHNGGARLMRDNELFCQLVTKLGIEG
jgi:hypothetical protein